MQRCAGRFTALAGLVLAVALGGGSLAVAMASSGGSPAAGGSAAGSAGNGGLTLNGSLVVQGSPMEGEQLQAARAARRANPIAVDERKASRTRFEHLGTARALQLASETFPEVVQRPAGGAPRLPAGERILRYEARNAAAIALPDGKHGVIESLGPIATPAGHGRFNPVNLALHWTGSAYAPANSDVAVRIAKHAAGGVSMPGDGVSLTAANAQGRPLGGSEGVQEGASVVYANTQTDTDTLAKPTTGGFEIDSLLRSVESPETLYFKVGMPAGAKLVSQRGPGGAQVVLDGHTIALIALPGAHDAVGTAVPVRMTVSGDTLVVAVKRNGGEYQYPIEVDPQAYDETLAVPGISPSETETNLQGDSETDWRYHENPAGKFVAPYSTGSGYVMGTHGTIGVGEHDEFRYGAHGQASIGFIEEESSASASGPSGAITKIEFASSHENAYEAELPLAEAGQSYSKVKTGFGDLWNESEKHYRGKTTENLVRIEQTSTNKAEVAEGYGFWFELNSAWVGINQEKGPEVAFNASSTTLPEYYWIGGFQNVLYGSGRWLGTANGAVGIIAKDPGLGVSKVEITDLTAGPGGAHWNFTDPIYTDHLCTGVWCNPTFTTYFTYNKEMAEGPNTFEVCAEDAAFVKACKETVVDVDNTPPTGLKIAKGLAESGAEINATQHQVTVEATDALSGIESISASVDGQEIEKPAGSCTGKCTVSRTMTIDGETLGAGEHKLIVTATDYAGNIEQKAYTFAIRDATPTKIGPGTVDPVTGQLALNASDVDIAGVGGVSRSYVSRGLTAGSTGPLGPQWSLSAGIAASLKLLPDGNAELVTPSGAAATFYYNAGKFEAPKGDENLKLEPKEEETGKGITEYVLNDPAAGTSTLFKQPYEHQFVIPTLAGEVSKYGSGSGDTNAYAGALAVGPGGNTWVADSGNARVDEFNVKGQFIKAFGYGVETGASELQTCTFSCLQGISGTGPGQFTTESGIAVASNGDIWVTTNNDKLKEFNEKGAFLGEAGEAGEGAGAMNSPAGVAIDVNGDVWVADSENARVDEFNEKREFIKAYGFGVSNGASELQVCTTSCKAGLKGTATGEFGRPVGITSRNNYVWVSDYTDSRIEKFNGSGGYLGSFGTEGTGKGQFSGLSSISVDSKGDIWATDEYARIQEFSEGGQYLGQLASSELDPPVFYRLVGGTAVSSTGTLWVMNQGRLQEWTHATWVPTKTESTAPGDDRSQSYRAVTVEGQTIVEPIEVMGPVPAGVSCGKNPAEVIQGAEFEAMSELKAGCRALWFTYDEKTAAGESMSEWGEYNGRLGSVSFLGYNPSSKKMEGDVVAKYLYDKQGRLRAEWDPRIEKSPACGGSCSALKTTYGYDAEGHVTALTPSSQQPWVFTYGAISNDPGTGRLLKVTRAHPKAEETEEAVKKKLSEQQLAPVNTAVPSLSGTAVVGVSMGVSTGTWSNGHVAYAYQWEDCNTEGKACTPIPGAVNENYTVASSDVGHKLVAQVQALDSGGAVASSSLPSGVVASSGTKTEGTRYSPGEGSTIEYRVPVSGSGAPHEMTSHEMIRWGQLLDLPEEATAIFPPDEPQGWPASKYTRATVFYMDGHARTTNTATPSGGISTVEYNQLNEVTRTLSAGDRAIAMKESCESEFKCKSTEVAKALSSEKIYNAEGTQLLETYGPEHMVKLPGGGEEETRNRQKFAYNENEPKKEIYNLATKEWQWAEGAVNKELGKHETTTSYSDTEEAELGWKLRKPILVSEKVSGKTTTEGAAYSPETGAPLEEFTATTTLALPILAQQFGSEGSGNAQFNHPESLAFDASGNLWVDDKGNSRLEKLTATGQFIAAYGSKGAGSGQLGNAWGLAINKSTGNVYVAEMENNRIQEFNSSGAFVRTFGFGVTNGEEKFQNCTTTCRAGTAGAGNGQFKEPSGVAIDNSGNVWVADYGNNRIQEFSATGEFIRAFGSKGSGNGQFNEPGELAFSDGNLYVTDQANHRVQEFSSTGKYVSQFGSSGTGAGQFQEPWGIAVDPVSGNLYVLDSAASSRVEEFNPNGIFIEEFGSGSLVSTDGVAVNQAGEIYVTEQYAARVKRWTPMPSSPSFASAFGNTGSESEKLSSPSTGAIDSHGNIWVVDHGKNRVVKFTAERKYSAAYGSKGAGAGQFSEPSAVVVNQSTGNVFVMDTGNNRVDELNSEGKFVSAFGFGVTNGKAELQTCTSTCQAGIAGSGNGQFSKATGITLDSSGNVWVADTGNNRVQELSSSGAFVAAYGTKGSGSGQYNEPSSLVYDSANWTLYVVDTGNDRVQKISTAGAYVSQFGAAGSGNGQFAYPYGVGVDPRSGNVYVGDPGHGRIEQFTPSGSYLNQFATKGSGNGQTKEAGGIAVNSSGAIYVVDSGNSRLEEWVPAPRPGNEGARDSRTIYYSAEANSEYAACGSHPEWANLACQTEPVVQPGDSGPPSLPVTTTTYNMWDEPETIVETIGSVKRTTTKTYDNAGRLTGSEETSTSSEDTALPAVTDQYSAETGAMVKEADTVEGSEKTITSAFNTLGQLVSYTDAEGAVTKYTYDIDGRIEELSEPNGSQIYTYDPTTGFLTKLWDSTANTFTASYGVAGEMLTEGYPNGITAKYTYNTIGQATNLVYEKTTHCTEKCVWFSDAETFGPEGELATQTSTLASETYSYNELGQLTKTEETPVGGKGCITRAYGYDEITEERTSLTTREPNEKGECTSEGGLVEGHTYDVLGRLLDPGVAYDQLGNLTKVPALDAGGEAITSSFYVDNQIATQEQGGKTIAYSYDPAGRTLATKKGKTLTFDHYAGPGEALTWTCEEEESKKECQEQKATTWTRDIPGIDGGLDAIKTSGSATMLQLHDLQGNIAATVEDSETATKLQSTYNSTEFGVPSGSKAPKYAWLGASGAQSELETGVITKAGASYVPQLARTIQTEAIAPPGAAPNGIMATEVYIPPELPWANQSGDEGAEHTVAQQRVKEREAEEAACRANPHSCAILEDPVEHLRAWEAEGRAQALRKKVKEGGLIDFLGGLYNMEQGPEEDLEALFGRNKIEEWALSLASSLERCVTELHRTEHSHGGCRVNIEDEKIFFIPLPTIDFNIWPEVSWCEGMSSDTKEVHWCYLINNGQIDAL